MTVPRNFLCVVTEDTCEQVAKDTEEKILCRSPFRSGRRSLVCARLTNKEKAEVQRGRALI